MAVSQPSTMAHPGRSRAFSKNVGARVRIRGHFSRNCATRSSTSSDVSDGLSTLDTESSKATGAPVIREATSASLRCPSCSGRKEPGSTAPCQGSLTSVRPSGYTVTVCTPHAESGSMRARVGLVCPQRATSSRSPSVSREGMSKSCPNGFCQCAQHQPAADVLFSSPVAQVLVQHQIVGRYRLLSPYMPRSSDGRRVWGGR